MGSSAARLRGREFLIGCEVALALMLLTGAGLMIRSLQQIESTGIGLDASRLIALDLTLPEKQYRDVAVRAALMRELLARERAIPGVLEAAVTSALPLHTVAMQNFHISGRPEPERGASPVTDIAQVSPEFLQIMGLRLQSGRWFTDTDPMPTGSSKDVAMVNEAFARKIFPRGRSAGEAANKRR